MVCLGRALDAAWWWDSKPEGDVGALGGALAPGEHAQQVSGPAWRPRPRLAILSVSGRIIEWTSDSAHAWHVDGVKHPRKLFPSPAGGQMLIQSGSRWAIASMGRGPA